jgi:hypothetical protein
MFLLYLQCLIAVYRDFDFESIGAGCALSRFRRQHRVTRLIWLLNQKCLGFIVDVLDRVRAGVTLGITDVQVAVGRMDFAGWSANLNRIEW